jgi:hypothetical protein
MQSQIRAKSSVLKKKQERWQWSSAKKYQLKKERTKVKRVAVIEKNKALSRVGEKRTWVTNKSKKKVVREKKLLPVTMNIQPYPRVQLGIVQTLVRELLGLRSHHQQKEGKEEKARTSPAESKQEPVRGRKGKD